MHDVGWPIIASIVALLAAAVLVVVRGWLRRRGLRSMRAVRREFRSRVDRYKRTSKHHVREELLRDREIAAAVEQHAREMGHDEAATWRRARSYVEEIVPSFNLLSYYRLGHAVARVLIPLLYKVSVGHEAREPLDAIPRDSVVIYLMNHRSNADYVVVAYVLSGKVAISYAVGEWARVWPLEAVFKSFGSYFVRRRYREALYHKVLERYVQLITRNGVTQGIFLEGGLTRDGRFRPPKLGLLDYLVRVKADPEFDRPVFVIPVAINYDRVLEDRSLLRELQSEDERLPRSQQVREVASYVIKVSFRFLTRRARRYGRACVNFGAPLNVDAWLAENPGVLELPREQRLPRLGELAEHVMQQIGAIMPVTAVPLAASALLRHPGSTIERHRWEGLIEELRQALRAAGAKLVGEERSPAELLDRALVMLTLRRVVVAEGSGFQVDRSQDLLLRYYANSIEHYFEDRVDGPEATPRPPASGAPKTESASFQAPDGVALRYSRLATGSDRVIVVAPGILLHRESLEHRLLAKRLGGIADVVTLDVRGHGDSRGAFTWGLKEPADVAALAAWLRGRYRRVGGLGFSYGGYHTLVAAARERCFDAVATVGTFHRLFLLDHNPLTRGLLRSLPLVMRRERRLTRLSFWSFGRRAKPSRIVSQVAPTPLLIVHGTDDWLIPSSHARTLYDRAGEPKTLRIIERGLHAEHMLVDDPEPLVEPLLSFFKEHL